MSKGLSPKQPVSVLVLIHTPKLEILLLERATHRGYWQSVTGSREGNESLHDTALREVAEETGLDAGTYPLTEWNLSNRFAIFEEWRHRYAPGMTHNLEHVFSLETPDTLPIRISPSEHLTSQWVPWQKAANVVFSWTNRDAILLLAEDRLITR